MSIQISQPVRDIRNRLIVDAGTDVLEWAKSHLFTSDYLKKKSKFKEVSFFVEDCQELFELPKYKNALDSWAPRFRDWLGEMWAPSVVFEELKLLKDVDRYSYRHVLIVAVVGARMLETWIHSQPTLKRSFQALVCHRLGKARMAQSLLQKKGELEDSEKKVIFEQPLVGFILNASYWGNANHLCARVALQHQEDRKGTGYPYGTKTNSLVLDVLRILDRFDALISSRPFRFKEFSVREALDIIRDDASQGKIDEDVFKAFVDLMRKEKLKNYKEIKIGTVGREAKA